MKNNLYYHEFIPGANSIYWLAPVVLLVIALLALVWGSYIPREVKTKKMVKTKRPKMNDHGIVKVIYRSDTVDLIIAVLVAIKMCLMFDEQCGRGLLQYMDNGLTPGESGVWSALAAFMVTVALTVVYCGVAYVLQVAAKALGACLRIKYLRRYGYKACVRERRSATNVVKTICRNVRRDHAQSSPAKADRKGVVLFGGQKGQHSAPENKR